MKITLMLEVLIEEGDWVLLSQWDEPRLWHYCDRTLILSKGIKLVTKHDMRCIGCKLQPPDTMLGFVSMMEWER